MTNVEELLRDALAAEAEQYEAAPEMWTRIAEARPRPRRSLMPLVAVAAAGVVVVGTVALLRDDEEDGRVITVSPAITSTSARPSGGCPDIHFEPNSDNVAFNIRSATAGGYPPDPEGDCRVAEEIIRHVTATHNFVSGPREFDDGPLRCTVVTEEVDLPVGHYTCYRTTRRVTWDKT